MSKQRFNPFAITPTGGEEVEEYRDPGAWFDAQTSQERQVEVKTRLNLLIEVGKAMLADRADQLSVGHTARAHQRAMDLLLHMEKTLERMDDDQIRAGFEQRVSRPLFNRWLKGSFRMQETLMVELDRLITANISPDPPAMRRWWQKVFAGG